MNKRTKAKQLKKKQTVNEALAAIEPLFAHLLTPPSEMCPTSLCSREFENLSSPVLINDADDAFISDGESAVDWSIVPPSLDPSRGELGELRSMRKREQLQSLIGYIEPELKRLAEACTVERVDEAHSSKSISCSDNDSDITNSRNITVVEFGSGSGHLSLLLAHRHPYAHFILIERKEYTVSVARRRVQECSLPNVSMFTGDLSDLNAYLSGRRISLGIGLHCCGLFTDMALDACITHRASFVISPCCYGQIGRPPVSTLPTALDDDARTLAFILQSRSTSIFQAFPEQLRPISSAADCISNFVDDANELLRDEDVLSQPNFLLAKRCMMAIDIDRLCRVCEYKSESQSSSESELTQSEVEYPQPGGRYVCKVASLRPLACSPKNNVIIGRFVGVDTNKLHI